MSKNKKNADKIGIDIGCELVKKTEHLEPSGVMLALESACVLVVAHFVKRGGDEIVIDALTQGIKERIKLYRMKGVH